MKLDWQNDWVYVSNSSSSLPNFDVKPPEWLRGWYRDFTARCKDQVAELMERIVRLQKMRVTAASVVLNFVQRSTATA